MRLVITPVLRSARGLWAGVPPLVALAAFGLACAAYAGGFPDLQLPESMQVQVVSNGMRVNGLKTRIYAFRSPQDADVLAGYFNTQWDERIARSRFGPWDILAHRAGGYLVTVQMRSDTMQGTRGYIAFTNIFAAAESGRNPPEVDLPMLPGTEVVQNLRADDLGRESHTLVLASKQSASQNLDFYRTYFRRRGFEPISRGALAKAANGGAMILNRGSAQLNVAVAEREGITIITIVKVRE